ncbi:MAG: UDP-N-acetylmuramoyl-L-alanyl-D-glutamate--2,6-diaminopimelate ligase [Syntrophobacterales bacterium]|nr:UDP-N-acetylmuramoyl-L-alanyl-D-glutamate--2,6-diaminopimelate ligase [Syntrophobacterales bacterium]
MGESIRKLTVSYLIDCLNRYGVRAELAEGSPETVITGITTDSRTVERGEIFVAIRGTHRDGHLFIPDAIKRGASAIIRQYNNYELDLKGNQNVAILNVSDSQKAVALAAAALYEFPTERLHLIGVTGTNGKTTTTVLIEAIYRQAGFEIGRVGTIGYHWKGKAISAPLTTPDPIMLQQLFAEMANDGVTHVVMEVSSHALYQKRVFGCSYDIAVFTNLSHDHLDFHETMEDYFQAKSLLFLEHLAKSRGCAVINIDDPYGIKLTSILRGEPIEIITYGIQNNSSLIRPLSYCCDPNKTLVAVKTPMGEMSIKTKLLGRLNVYNILAAIGVGVSAGITLRDISEGIASVEGVDGRLQKVSIDAPFYVIVDYAHTPDAMEKALSCIREWASNRIIALFGCGGDRDRTKRPLMAHVATKYADIIIITSDNPRTEDPLKIIEDILKGIPDDWILIEVPEGNSKQVISPSQHFYVIPDRREAIKTSLKIAKPGDVIFIGGKGHETYQIIGQEKLPFDDRCVVRECYDEICRMSPSNP